MDSMTNYYAQPIARRVDGVVLTDDIVECLDDEDAIRRAQNLAARRATLVRGLSRSPATRTTRRC
jgi:hypothetical protein